VIVPAALQAITGRDPSWSAWLDGLSRLIDDVMSDWALSPDGPASHGQCALVVPVRTADGSTAALKLAWPHDEAEHEPLALQHWHGDGAVLLLRADPHRGALLLERAGTTDLGSVDDLDACEIVGALLRRVHRPAPPQLALLSRAAGGWAARLASLPRSAPIPRRLVEQAAGLCRDLGTDPATDGVLLHTDAHYENVLAADREPWLLIDPKPRSGDPHFEPAPLLWNRWDEVVATGDVRWAVRRRLDAITGALGLDPDRARDWVIVRETVNALWSVEAATAADRALTADDHEWITRAVAIAKAVQG